ncbi:MAG: GntR family transcriptional regulator [Porticoccaceae bacterium]
MSKNNKHLTPPSAENIFMNLKADISLGLLHPRERLIEAELVERFNSHRPAVREALAMLTKLGLVVHVPNKGASVAELNVNEVTKIFEIRIELESLAASWITLPLSKAAIDELEQILKKHSSAIDNNDYREIFRLDVLFHSQINVHCGNNHLEEMIDLMSDRGLLARWSVQMTPKFLKERLKEHEDILNAIRTCDQERLITIMRAHNTIGLDWFIKSIRESRTVELSRVRDMTT